MHTNSIYRFMGKQKALMALLVLFIAMTIATPSFLTSENITGLLSQSVAYTIIALGVTLTILAGACDLSVGGIMSLAGIITIGLQASMPTWLAAIIALMAGAIIGFINGFLSVHQKTEPFIITLGMGLLLKGVNLELTNGRSIGGSDLAYAELGAGSIFHVPYLVIIAVVLVVLFHLLTTRTSYGRNLYAIGGDYDVAVYSGIKALKQKWIAFVISGITAAIGGILYSARLNAGSAIYGDTTALIVNCSVVIGGTSFAGGVGGILPSVIGILLFNLVENAMNLLALGSYTQQAVEGVIIVFIIGLDLYTIKRKREKV